MPDLLGGTEGWIVSPVASLAVLVVLGSAVLVVHAGEREQHARRVPAPQSSVIAKLREGRVDGVPVTLSEAGSVRLAAIVNQLPVRPNGQRECGGDDGSLDQVVFSTVSGAVVVSVDLGGCLGVSVSSHGSDWGVDRWDPDAVLKSAIAADLRSGPNR